MADHSTYIAVLRNLLLQKVAALGTVDSEGHPQVSMVPFAIAIETGELIIHVSTLASHTAYLRNQPVAALMVMQAEQDNTAVHALPRVSLQVESRFIAASMELHARTKEAYTARFPDMEFMTEFADFSFVRLVPRAIRLVSGFGAARNLSPDQWLLAATQHQAC